MTDTYWMRDDANTFALVVGADERDRLIPHGWVVVDEPDQGFVHVWKDGIEQPGRAPVALHREVLSQAGWVAGPPPGGKRPVAPDAKPKMSTAAGGSTKEK